MAHLVTSGTTEERFDAVVSNADLHHTYDRLYRGEPAAGARTQKLERMDWSMSLFVIYFGTRRRYPGGAHHTVLFGPRYREMLREIFHGPELPPDFSLYLHQPTVTDPSLAPPGCESFYVLAPVPHLGAAADRLGAAIGGIRGADPGGARDGVAGTAAGDRRQARVHAGRFSRPAERLPGLGLLRRAAPGPERLLSSPQPRPGDPGALHRRRGDASGSGRSGRDQLGQGDDAPGARRSRLAADGGGVMTRRPNRLARQILAHHSKSFAFAGRLLPAWCRDDAAALYAWCRRCDDAVDGPRRRSRARRRPSRELRAELARIYGAGVE